MKQNKNVRIVARTTEDTKGIIQLAADTLGVSLSQFIIETCAERAHEIIERTHTLKLTMVGSEALFNALENPPKANTKLLDAAKSYKERVSQ